MKFNLRVTNDGGDVESFKLKGVTNATAGFSVSYTNSAGTSVTSAVKAGTHTFTNMPTTSTGKVITVRVAVSSSAAIGSKKTIDLTTTSASATNKTDIVTFEVAVVS